MPARVTDTIYEVNNVRQTIWRIHTEVAETKASCYLYKTTINYIKYKNIALVK